MRLYANFGALEVFGLLVGERVSAKRDGSIQGGADDDLRRNFHPTAGPGAPFVFLPKDPGFSDDLA